ncbi:unnamed protein product, partial [Amoebophrya sp. A25]
TARAELLDARLAFEDENRRTCSSSSTSTSRKGTRRRRSAAHDQDFSHKGQDERTGHTSDLEQQELQEQYLLDNEEQGDLDPFIAVAE